MLQDRAEFFSAARGIRSLHIPRGTIRTDEQAAAGKEIAGM
jgi:hypothetical protein